MCVTIVTAKLSNSNSKRAVGTQYVRHLQRMGLVRGMSLLPPRRQKMSLQRAGWAVMAPMRRLTSPRLRSFGYTTATTRRTSGLASWAAAAFSNSNKSNSSLRRAPLPLPAEGNAADRIRQPRRAPPRLTFTPPSPHSAAIQSLQPLPQRPMVRQQWWILGLLWAAPAPPPTPPPQRPHRHIFQRRALRHAPRRVRCQPRR